MAMRSLSKRLGGLIGFGLLFLVACSGTAAEETAVSPQEATSQALTEAILASSEPPLDLNQLSQDIAAAEQLWLSQEITHYRLDVSYREPTWNTQNLTLLIEDGEVTQEKHTCVPLRTCILNEVDIDSFEMIALFDIARQVVALQDHNTHITFNQRLGFPNAIGYSEATWIVQSVTPIVDE